jgi:hypothetical protein
MRKMKFYGAKAAIHLYMKLYRPIRRKGGINRLL